MNKGETELAKLGAALGKQSGTDHLLNTVKAALNAVPIVGGSIASLMDDYIPESRQKRIEVFAQRLADELGGLQDKVKEDFVRTDEFAYLFTRVFNDVSREYQEDKLKAYRRILTNSLCLDVDSILVERFLTLTEQLDTVHLKILSAYMSDEQNEPKLRVFDGREDYTLLSVLSVLLPGLSEQMLEAGIRDLYNQGLVHTIPDTVTNPARLRTEYATNLKYDPRHLERGLTWLGRRYVDFVIAAV